ncbi:MAG TPA: response regulator [Cyclobacteriaceae bacterium]|jgi:CheY-like chemotaxis protein|nr:response regulator [Cyclobacteriaceae bacterium]
MTKWRGKGIEVLLVEDSPDDYELTRNVLEENAINYHHAKDGEEAINFVTSTHEESFSDEIHLILLDLKLPKLNGLEVLKKIRSDMRSHNIPVVILSSTDDEREITEAYDLGANSFVIKPIEFERFVRILSSVIDYWTLVNEMSR